MADQGWLAHVVAEVQAARLRIADIGAASGLTALPSATNFVALDTHRDGAFARALIAALEGQGVFARMPGVAPLDRCIRISAAPIHELDVFEDALPRAMAALNPA